VRLQQTLQGSLGYQKGVQMKRFCRIRFGITTVIFLALPAIALEPAQVLPLWPGRTAIDQETVQPDKGDGVIRLTDIANPSMAVFPAPPTSSPTPAVLVCPGGGYAKLAYNKEGTEVAAWLNTLGITVGVLKYRVPNDREGALADAQRAMGLLRHHAMKWHIDPSRIGVLGFSAGGHLAARTSTNYAARTYPAVDEADTLPCRPDFTILIYPAYIAEGNYTPAPDIPVIKDTPPAFILQTQDDSSYINSSIAYYIALKDAGVPAELHLFPEGGHGYGLRPSENAVSGWPVLCARWLKTAGILR
jgi:acetyl esterase/lipase